MREFSLASDYPMPQQKWLVTPRLVLRKKEQKYMLWRWVVEVFHFFRQTNGF